ncbi:MAG: hypothetical protein R3B47_13585 [Bacteroidia bacterium]
MLRILPFLFFLTCSLHAFSQKIAPLFQDSSVLELELFTDFKELTRDVGDERESHPAKICLKGSRDTFELKLKVRGNFRRKRHNCNFPPLRLDFKKDSMNGTIFEGINKMKLVTHCEQKSARHHQIVLQEHILYQAWEVLTPVHFKSRLAKITYHNSAQEDDIVERWGLLLEPVKNMATRCNGLELEPTGGIGKDATDRAGTELLYLFEYMVGNTDFSVIYQHNVKLIQPDSGGKPIPVPYDWDFCGWIGAPYAKPNPTLGIETVQQRKYRGFCWPDEEQLATLQHIVSKKADLLAIIEREPGLDERYRKRMIKYLEDFFEWAEKPKRVEADFLRACRDL